MSNKLGTRKYTQKSFIERAISIHGTKYDYNKVVYTRPHDKIVIVCPTHGEFSQTANSHILGHGCSKCYHQNKRLTTEKFLIEAKKVHGTKYRYSKVNCDGTLKNVITCKSHGDFLQNPRLHLNGAGCRKCADEYTASLARKTTEQFIKEAQAVHGNKYDYSKSVYTGVQDKITIICKEHGKFVTTPNMHLCRRGICLKCKPKSEYTNFSRMSIEWIEKEARSRRMKNVQHAMNGSEFQIPGTRFKVDGYHERTKTVFEFYGDKFHGNPKLFKRNDTPHPFSDKTALQLYASTMRREKKLKQMGYRVISIWETDFLASKQ